MAKPTKPGSTTPTFTSSTPPNPATTASPSGSATSAPASKSRAVNLNFADFQEIVTHLFILQPAPVRKFFGWKKIDEEDPRNFENIVHQHSYRTMTSQGEAMTQCAHVLAHFHTCKIKLDDKGTPVLNEKNELQIEVGPAQTTSGNKVVPWPYDEVPHTHESYYVRSNKIKVDSISPDMMRKIQEMDPFNKIGLTSTSYPTGSKGA
jgi:hypothetical protein